jgi:hypothetical protein
MAGHIAAASIYFIRQQRDAADAACQPRVRFFVAEAGRNALPPARRCKGCCARALTHAVADEIQAPPVWAGGAKTLSPHR